MSYQIPIDFTTHKVENNTESQQHLEDNTIHFNAQCKKVYELLKSGVRLTVMSAMNDYQVMSLPRRILDLKQNNKIEIQSRFIPGTRIKEYYL